MGKRYYADHTREVQQQLFAWHKKMYEVKRDNPGKKVVNGCLNFMMAAYNYLYNGMEHNPKFIILFRDPADWMWASFNYWQDPELDANGPISNNWANKLAQYRSPELFHEMWLAGLDKFTFGGNMETKMDDNWKNVLLLSQIVGKENILFIKSEDMEPENVEGSQLLKRLSNFTGLSIDGFNEQVAHGRTNCNANKGGTASCSKKEASSGYPITEGRWMFQKTRKLVYLRFYRVCKIWAEEFGIVYPACLDAATSTEN